MLSQAFAACINHLLEPAGWARDRLAPHAGKTLRFVVVPFDLALAIDEDGRVRAPASGPAQPADASPGAPDLTLRLSHFLLPRLLLGDEAAYQQVDTEGDTGLAADVQYLFRHLRWDVEDDLSRVFGDIAAHRLARAGRAALELPLQAGNSVAQMAAEYLKEENPTLAKREPVRQFVDSVDVLRDDLERLEKRIRRLEQRPQGRDGS